LAVATCGSFEQCRPAESIRGIKYLALGGPNRVALHEIGALRELRKLTLNAVGKVASLHFLTACRKLEALSLQFSTNILDGDLGFLERMPKLKRVHFKNRAHYNRRWQDFARNK
jgi:hypothetical protein